MALNDPTTQSVSEPYATTSDPYAPNTNDPAVSADENAISTQEGATAPDMGMNSGTYSELRTAVANVGMQDVHLGRVLEMFLLHLGHLHGFDPIVEDEKAKKEAQDKADQDAADEKIAQEKADQDAANAKATQDAENANVVDAPVAPTADASLFPQETV